ncbi:MULTISPECIES: DAPG hydrolase family protein [unclassified Streptomyces]|uniref:DAPG hydrolase family protein n=1 Tax=unclassified Streptomyces TaxID=2593676 RepID=UPI003D93CAFC
MTTAHPAEGLVPVTYFPAPTQDVFAANAQRIRDKPYAHFFRKEMYLHREVLPALQRPMDPGDALGTSPEELNTLLDAGHHKVENGYCLLADGTAYVASRTPLPGATGEMVSWFFWWYMGESERYSLWHPYNRVFAEAADPAALSRPGLTHEQRYIGNTVHVTEYVGPKRVKVKTRFVQPSDWGLDTGRFAQAGVVAQICGEIILAGVRVGRMLRLARETDEGLELRTRFWLGDLLTLGSVDLAPMLRALGLKRRLINSTTAYEQLFNDQVGMTHLAGFLPALYAQFGAHTA